MGLRVRNFCWSAVGALAGAPLQIFGRSASRSAAPQIESERAWSGAPDFAGALILWTLQVNLAFLRLNEFRGPNVLPHG